MTLPEKIKIVKETINAHFGVDISLKSRKREVVMARQFYYKWMKENTNYTLIGMGATLPLKQDHTTIRWAIECFNDKMDMYGEIDVEWDEVNKKINQVFEREKIKENEFSLAFNPS